MKYVLLVLLLIGKTAWCQNLVPNPSFEVFSDCPQYAGDIHLATGWSSYRESPDYFNTCANLSQPILGVPLNARGYQWPHSGDSYAAVATFHPAGVNIREAMGIELSQPLAIGTKYYLTFFVSKPGTFNHGGATNNFGAKLTTTAYSEANPIPIDNSAQVRDSLVVIDTLNWVKITGSFTADLAYTHLALGNFYDDAHTTVVDCPVYAYYYVDDVCLTDDSIFNASWTGVSHQSIPSNFSIYPNPSHQAVNLTLPQGSTQIEIFNAVGQSVYASNVSSLHQVVDVSLFSEGVYFVRVRSYQGVQTQKFVVQR